MLHQTLSYHSIDKKNCRKTLEDRPVDKTHTRINVYSLPSSSQIPAVPVSNSCLRGQPGQNA